MKFNYSKSKKHYFELLKYAEELKNNGKLLYQENPEAFSSSLNFREIIEKNLQYVEKNRYITILQSFLTGSLNTDDFSFIFIFRFPNILEKSDQLENSYKEKSKNLTF